MPGLWWVGAIFVVWHIETVPEDFLNRFWIWFRNLIYDEKMWKCQSWDFTWFYFNSVSLHLSLRRCFAPVLTLVKEAFCHQIALTPLMILQTRFQLPSREFQWLNKRQKLFKTRFWFPQRQNSHLDLTFVNLQTTGPARASPRKRSQWIIINWNSQHKLIFIIFLFRSPE